MSFANCPRRARNPTAFFHNPINHEDEMDLEGGVDFVPNHRASCGFDSATALGNDTSSSASPGVSSRALKRHKDATNSDDDQNYHPNSPQKKKAARVSNKRQGRQSLFAASLPNPPSTPTNAASAIAAAGIASRPTILVKSESSDLVTCIVVDPEGCARFSVNPLVRRIIAKPIRECTDGDGNIDFKHATFKCIPTSAATAR